MKFKKSFFFKSNSKEYFLFKLLNIGNQKRDDLKFMFHDPKAGVINIYTEEEEILKNNDVTFPYSEVSYHADGTFMHKFPNYPVSSKEYINTSGEGTRRRKLSEIKDWEPLFYYKIYDYDLLRKKKRVPSDEKYVINSDKNFFNGSSLECMFILVNKSFSFNHKKSHLELIHRVKNITNSLDLLLAFAKIDEQGRWIEIEGLDRKVFSNLNVLSDLKRNT